MPGKTRSSTRTKDIHFSNNLAARTTSTLQTADLAEQLICRAAHVPCTWRSSPSPLSSSFPLLSLDSGQIESHVPTRQGVTCPQAGTRMPERVRWMTHVRVRGPPPPDVIHAGRTPPAARRRHVIHCTIPPHASLEPIPALPHKSSQHPRDIVTTSAIPRDKRTSGVHYVFACKRHTVARSAFSESGRKRPNI